MPRCATCQGQHWMRECPHNPANKLRALVDKGELCEARFGEGRVELNLIQDGSTCIVSNKDVRDLLKGAGFRWRPSEKGWFQVRCANGASVLDLVRTSVIEVVSDGDNASRIRVRDGLGLISDRAVADRLHAAGFATEHGTGAMRGLEPDSAALREAVEQGQRMRGEVEALLAEHSRAARDAEAEREACEFFKSVSRWFCQRDYERPLWVGMPLKRQRGVCKVQLETDDDDDYPSDMYGGFGEYHGGYHSR